MPVRGHWADCLRQAATRAVDEAAALHATTTRVPVNLHALAYQLGARLESSTSPDTPDGSLHRASGEWVIRFNEQRPLHRKRFTIAHEMAHLLFLSTGLQPPSSTGEYWVLEEACQVVASELLVPNTMAPTAPIPRSDLRPWMQGLAQRFLLSPEAASRYLLRRGPNCVATAGVLTISQEQILFTKWSEVLDSQPGWPGPRSILRLDDPRFPEFTEIVRSTSLDNRTLHSDHSGDSTFVVLPFGRSLYKRRNTEYLAPLTIVFQIHDPQPGNQLALF